MNDFDPMETLMEAGSEFEARTIIAVLEDAGIEARIFVLGNLGLPHALTPGARGVPVHVRRSQLERARQALAESREVGASVDWESVDVGDEPPPPARRAPSRLMLARAAGVVLVAGIVTVVVARIMGAKGSALSRSLVTVLGIAFLLIVISLAVREFVESRDRSPRSDGPEGDGGGDGDGDGGGDD